MTADANRLEDIVTAIMELAKERDELLNALIGMNVYFGSMAGGCEEEAEAAINECRRVIARAAVRQPAPAREKATE